jgi:hypothetical protein
VILIEFSVKSQAAETNKEFRRADLCWLHFPSVFRSVSCRYIRFFCFRWITEENQSAAAGSTTSGPAKAYCSTDAIMF